MYSKRKMYPRSMFESFDKDPPFYDYVIYEFDYLGEMPDIYTHRYNNIEGFRIINADVKFVSVEFEQHGACGSRYSLEFPHSGCDFRFPFPIRLDELTKTSIKFNLYSELHQVVPWRSEKMIAGYTDAPTHPPEYVQSFLFELNGVNNELTVSNGSCKVSAK